MIRKTLSAAALAVMMWGCGPAEVRIDEKQGVPSVTGTAEVTFGTLNCGTPITSGAFTVQTRVVTGGCELSFDQDVPLLKEADYTSIPELKGASSLVQRVELTINKLAFTDGTTGAALDVNTQLTSASLSINSQVVADKSTLSSLPKTVVLEGQALAGIKAKVDARQATAVHATCVVVVPDMPKPPTKLKIDYDAQPAVVIGTGKVLPI